MFAYKLNVLDELKKNGYNTTRLRREKLLGERVIQQLREEKMVGIIALEKICCMLDTQPGDVIKYVKDERQKDKIKRCES